MDNNTVQQINNPQLKRNTAYKLRIGSILSGKQTIEAERFKHLTLNDKQIVRVNVIANVIDKYLQEGEKKFGSITLDDGSGQIKVKSFGDDVDLFFSQLNQGDTIGIIGLLRVWNNEIYINPEIIKKKDPQFLLIRKLEVESQETTVEDKAQISALKDTLLNMIKDAEKDGGIDIESIITTLKEKPEVINQELKKLLEDGIAYEPRQERFAGSDNMDHRRFNSVMHPLNEVWAANALGMQHNHHPGIDLKGNRANAEVKFALQKNGETPHSWRVLDHEVNFNDGNKPCFWALGTYNLNQEIGKINVATQIALERKVIKRDLFIVSWEWMYQFDRHHEKGKTEKTTWDNWLRFPKYRDVPKTITTYQVKGGTINLTEGVDYSFFNIKTTKN